MRSIVQQNEYLKKKLCHLKKELESLKNKECSSTIITQSSIIEGDITFPVSISNLASHTAEITVCGDFFSFPNISGNAYTNRFQAESNVVFNILEVLNTTYSEYGLFIPVFTGSSVTIGLIPSGSCNGEFTIDVINTP